MIRIGERVSARFEIVERTGSGSMGTVFRARDLTSGGEVALKTLRVESSIDAPEERFAHEIRVLGELTHPGVVRYVAHGRTDEGEPYLAMEWIAGTTLGERLRAAEPLTFAEVTSLGAGLAAALAACHERSVVHRDLKPGNVMLRGADPELPVLVDFGLARLSSDASLTVSGTRLGTPRFMAPEQIRNARGVDGRADVFSLGCILFECATHRPAFRSDDAMDVMVKILLERAPRVRDACDAVPPALARLIDRALEPDRDARPTAKELASALADLDLLDAGPQSAPFEPSMRAPFSNTPSLSSEPVDTGTTLEAIEYVLPQPSGTFVGREAVLARLDALLDRPRATASIWGPPGIGKTRIALEAVSRLRRREPSLAPIYCELRDARTRNDLTRAVARALRLEPGADPSEAERAVGRALHARARTLLLLDGVDHLAPELAAFRAAMQARAPGLRLLFLSRERLELEGEKVELGPLSTEEAKTLFIERAREVLGDARFEDSLVEELVAAVSGIPLAVELFASRVDVLGVEGLRERVPRGEDLAAAMHDAIAASYAQLDARGQRALALCAIFPGTFGVAAAEALVGPSDVIASLRAKALLSSDHDGLRMLAPIRAFALRELSTEERRAALDRHAIFYAARAAEWTAQLDRSGSLGGIL